jgi:AAA15 family ATPase/GTPase
MNYISDLTIESFRGISDLQLKNLGGINIIVGSNNSGKTSILEALNLLKNPLDVVNAVRVFRMREFFLSFIETNELDHLDSFINIFNRNNKINRIGISGIMNNQSFTLNIEGVIEKRLFNIEEFKKDLRNRNIYINLADIADGETEFFIGVIKYTEDGKLEEKQVLLSRYDRLIPDKPKKEKVGIEYVSPIDHIVKSNHLNQLIKAGLKSEVIELLKVFDPQITGLEMVGVELGTIPYIEHSDLGLMPLSTYGDGLKKVLLLAASIIMAKDGILLIDEIETAIHVSALEKIFVWFVKACQKSNVQVFATTHSLEAIDALLKYVKNNNPLSAGDDPLRIITLKKQSQKTRARILSGKEALDSREEFDLELRQ